MNSNYHIPVRDILISTCENNKVGEPFTKSKVVKRNITDEFLSGYIQRCFDRDINISELLDVYHPDFYFDTVESIEDNGFQDVYDINIPEDNEYCANGFFSHNTGEKIRGERANVIVADEFGALNREIFETVIAGFGAVSMSPLERVKEVARKRLLEANRIIVPNDKVGGQNNQICIAGTADYDFTHFCDYWRLMRS